MSVPLCKTVEETPEKKKALESVQQFERLARKAANTHRYTTAVAFETHYSRKDGCSEIPVMSGRCWILFLGSHKWIFPTFLSLQYFRVLVCSTHLGTHSQTGFYEHNRLFSSKFFTVTIRKCQTKRRQDELSFSSSSPFPQTSWTCPIVLLYYKVVGRPLSMILD